QLLYRATLPTDGWSVYTQDVGNANLFYDQNLVGAPSGLQYNDELLAVNGRSVAGTASTAYVPAPDNWQVGETAVYHISRDGTEMDVPVSIVNWTLAAFLTYNFGTIGSALSTLGALLFLGLGWFTFWRRSEVSSARALLLFSTAVGASFISGVLPDGLSVQFNALAFQLTGFFSYTIFGILLAPSLLAFSLLFPQPKRVFQRHAWLMGIPVLLGTAVFIAVYGLNIPTVGWLGTLGMMVASIISLIHAGFTQRDAVSRAQMRWVMGGFSLGLGLFMINFPMAFGLITDPLLINIALAVTNLPFIIIGVSLSIAVLRYRLYDIDVIIRKTLVYTVLTGLLALVYFGTVVLLQSLVGQATNEQSPLIIVFSTLLIAALFTPLRQRVQASIDRRFFRKKYDAQQVLAQFAQTARDETDMAALQVELLRVVQETMQPEGVSLWLPPVIREKRPLS
ncbi:MAG: hypothetical protein IAF02_24910, partial [Anaerolineae bacterium]|nr:hypothetical protein [Anaerolineae bacterium]